MKRILAVIIALALALSLLSGCGGSQKNEDSIATGGTNNQEDTQKPVEDVKPVTLTMLVSGNKSPDGKDIELDILPKMIKEKFSNINLEATKLPDEQYNTSIKTKLAAGEGPDIFLVWPKTGVCGAIDLSKAGYLMDISGYNIWNNFAKGAVEDMSYDGKVRAVAKGLDLLGIYYNKALFQKAGITEEPKDWTSFLGVCQKLKDAGITPIVTGDKDPWYLQFALYQIAANVVYPDDMDFDVKLQAGEESLTNPKWVKAIEMFNELYAKGYVVKNSLGIGSAQACSMFIDGKAAMIFDGTWDYNTLMAKGEAEFERGFMATPANESGKATYASASTAAGYAVNASTKNADAVKQVFEYWFDVNSSLFAAYRDASSSISVVKGVPLENELFKGVYDIYQNGKSVYFCNQMWPGAVATDMETKLQEMIGGQKTTPQDVTKAMDAKFKELWKN
ncbi:raffinose/stachyose/melibiose transport system substrate-binding protein [Anaerobacterium chartisolvens]|uniref:Raffinose/stachyose/melibiose transport system substrate-binding protein n=1 Tax=Anaerobacterium chartisolvens TaxID=1297424 RepID=A0A369B8N0_9FIRM|nr:extracellular solute-binding protein [Anaerobacterium chartisolvens]RCX17890.1 raffinose/stachyose/melibiose transport system substrate-binding protein [Anaerobacterium chartisolvens]